MLFVMSKESSGIRVLLPQYGLAYLLSVALMSAGFWLSARGGGALTAQVFALLGAVVASLTTWKIGRMRGYRILFRNGIHLEHLLRNCVACCLAVVLAALLSGFLVMLALSASM